MFDRVLVANRGEIAVRIIASLRRLGIGAVLAASPPDARGLAARLADDVVVLRGARPADSYLDIPQIIAAAREAGCAAIHPGYGFLSERPEFARACEDAGIVFIGPPATVLERLGDKVEARRMAEAVGVPVVPGWDGAEGDVDLVEQAAGIGFPVILKARGGGGGRGMRLVTDEHMLREAAASARREAEAAFGDGRLFIEKYVVNAHHVEVQVVADRGGAVLHLGERDCSVQRRHQKLIEEAPSPAVDDGLRGELADAAVRLMRHVGYVNAGTVEFLVGEPGEGARPFFFIEVNPRLQVEHPVTEMVTGFDLVELQLRIAAGEPLRLAQEHVRFAGHAVEFRINAEDSAAGFQPAPGRLSAVDPGEGPCIRGDFGYAAGDEVPGFYDSLIGKLIVHADDRESALKTAAKQLGRPGLVDGVQTNVRLHRAITRHPDFRAGEASVAWLEEHLEGLVAASRAGPDLLAAVAAMLSTSGEGFDGPRWIGAGSRDVWLDGGGGPECVSVRPDGRNHGEAVLGGRCYPFRVSSWKDASLVLVGRPPWAVAVTRVGPSRFVAGEEGADHVVALVGPPPLLRQKRAAGSTGQQVTAPLSGTVAAVEVAEGQSVDAGALLLILEAMKLEHRVAAPVAGVVRALHVAPGDVVAAGQPLVDLG